MASEKLIGATCKKRRAEGEAAASLPAVAPDPPSPKAPADNLRMEVGAKVGAEKGEGAPASEGDGGSGGAKPPGQKRKPAGNGELGTVPARLGRRG